jgi:S1-C subfamily serine protease
VTNHHVIEHAVSITVTLQNGNSYEATLIGSDMYSDLAVLRIDAPRAELHPLPLADSNTVRVGQKAIAIGSPLATSSVDMGLDRSPTVTQGIVSAVDRSMPVVDDGFAVRWHIEGLVQTDASINPGNSGGPLLNSSGEVIGVNTAIISGAQGLGFAVPSSLVSRNVANMIAGNPVGRPFIGITYLSLDSIYATLGNDYYRLGLPLNEGALLTSIVPGSAADQAGLRGATSQVSIQGYAFPFEVGGDIIIAMNGVRVTGSNFPQMIRRHVPGDVVLLTILRGEVEMEVYLTFGVMESQ